MNLHANAKLGLAGRRELVATIEAGASLRRAAASFGVSPATAHRWWHRWLAGQELGDRPSRPLRQPRRLSAAEEEEILARGVQKLDRHAAASSYSWMSPPSRSRRCT
jgi:transposase